jgi:hypothetical protein
LLFQACRKGCSPRDSGKRMRSPAMATNLPPIRMPRKVPEASRTIYSGSRCRARAALSVRNPRKVGCLRRPSTVHSRNRTCVLSSNVHYYSCGASGVRKQCVNLPLILRAGGKGGVQIHCPLPSVIDYHSSAARRARRLRRGVGPARSTAPRTGKAASATACPKKGSQVPQGSGTRSR